VSASKEVSDADDVTPGSAEAHPRPDVRGAGEPSDEDARDDYGVDGYAVDDRGRGCDASACGEMPG